MSFLLEFSGLNFSKHTLFVFSHQIDCFVRTPFTLWLHNFGKRLFLALRSSGSSIELKKKISYTKHADDTVTESDEKVSF